MYRLPKFLESHDSISYILLRPSQFLEKFLGILRGQLCSNKSDPSPLFNVASYWKSRNTEACAKKLSQILVSNIDKAKKIIACFRLSARMRFFSDDAAGKYLSKQQVN